MEQVNYNSGEVLESLNNKLDRDFNNMAVNSVNFAKYSNNVTNCITEIPQDIKLELVNGTLTLKAGSKIRIPNGKNSDDSLKFDEFIIETDIGCNFDNTNQKMVFFHPDKTTLWHCNVLTQQFSGDTQPTISWGYWYDIKNNIIKHTTNGSDWTTGFSLPLCIATGNDNGIATSIDQVFNGFGYIGSIIFALPNVKAIVPNGRNEDGSLKNIEWTNDKLILTDMTGWNTKTAGKLVYSNRFASKFNFQDLIRFTDDTYQYRHRYDEQENKWYWTTDSGATWVEEQLVIFSDNADITNNIVTKAIPKLTFRTIDQNDNSWLSGLSIPSDKYIDLTLGASGTTYTAPANGWFYLKKTANGSNQYIGLMTKIGILNWIHTTNGYSEVAVPCKKGGICTVSYAATGATNIFRFIYAEGEK